MWGHSQITGNEIVDKLANKGAMDNKSVNIHLTKEEIISCLLSRFLDYWDDQWKFTARGSCKGLDLLNVRSSIRQHVLIYKMKNRLHEKAMYRLRMGNAGVKKYLNRIGLGDSPLCDFCNDQVKETIEHYLFQCSGFEVQRSVMYCNLRQLNIKDITLKIVVGGNEQYSGISIAKYICDTDQIFS